MATHYAPADGARSRQETFATRSLHLAAFLDLYGARLIDLKMVDQHTVTFIFAEDEHLWRLVALYDNDGTVPLKSWRARTKVLLGLIERARVAPRVPLELQRDLPITG